MGRPKKLRQTDVTREQWDLAHLQLNEMPTGLHDPFLHDVDEYYLSHPDEHLLSILMNPDYFGWSCNKLFNTANNNTGLELLPMQCAILKELWWRPFPILIASRGFSKCITANTYIMTNHGIKTMGEIASHAIDKGYRYEIEGLSILGENGYFPVDYIWNNGEEETIKFTTTNGFNLEANYNHPVRIVKDSKIDWCKNKDLKIDDYVVIDRSEDWFPNTSDISVDEAYLCGLIVGDGGYTVRGRISFTTADRHLIPIMNKITKRIWGKEFKENKSDKYGYILYGVDIWDSLFNKYGFNSPVCAEKAFPTSILNSSREVIISFIRGLMDADGTTTNKYLCVGFCSKSKSLAYTLQFILSRLGIISVCKPRLNTKYNRIYYHLHMFGDNARLYYEKIGFGLDRKNKILEKMIKSKSNTNKDIIPHSLVLDKVLALKAKLNPNRRSMGSKLQFFPSNHSLKQYQLTYNKLKNILDLSKQFNIDHYEEYKFLENVYNKNYFYDKIKKLEKGNSITYDLNIPDDHTYITNGFISHNTFTLALYSMLRALFLPGRKIVITGAGFRQSKLVLAYAEQLWFNSPVFRDLCGANHDKYQGPHHEPDKHWMQIGESTVVGLPIGSGEKIRGQRAHDLITDEFSSLDPQIFEEVIAGFSVVNIDPISQVKHYKRLEYLKFSNKEIDQSESNVIMPNQTILSGTASFAFNHFYKYWKTHRNIILSQGDPEKMKRLGIEETLDYKKCSIIRIPVQLLPKGFMDQDQIDRAKANQASGIYQNEFCAVFSDDSSGFYRRSALEKATPTYRFPVITSSGVTVEVFPCLLRGNPNLQYVMAIDPALQQDNFAIVILELHEDHARIVHVWTTNAQNYIEVKGSGGTKEGDFWAYTIRKIRDLMKLFNVIHIAIDSQGGGRTISELLKNDKYIEKGEQPIFELDRSSPLWDGTNRPTDAEPGLHILELVHFANGKYTLDANHGMKNDFEQRNLLFPYSDSIEIVLAGKSDMDAGRLYDTLENILLEIEELKRELTMIVHDQTQSGRERWGAPKVKISSNIGDLTDDRYSALLMANFAARRLRAIVKHEVEYQAGGFVGQGEFSPYINFPADPTKSQPFYVGPAWLTRDLNNVAESYGLVIKDGAV